MPSTDKIDFQALGRKVVATELNEITSLTEPDR